MAQDKRQVEAIRLTKLIQGVGEGEHVSQQQVVDSFEKAEGRASVLGKWANSAVSFFLPRAVAQHD